MRALRSPQESWLQPTGHHHMTLYVPLRPSPEDIQGLVAVEGFIARSDYRRKHEQILEMVGYLRHAARALKNRAEHERLYSDAMQRAQDLQNLLDADAAPDELQGELSRHSRSNAAQRRKCPGAAGADGIDLSVRSGQWPVDHSRRIRAIPLEVRQEARFAPGKGLAGYVYKTGRLWNVRDTQNDPRYQAVKQSARSRPLHHRRAAARAQRHLGRAVPGQPEAHRRLHTQKAKNS